MRVKFYLESSKTLKAKKRTIWCYVREDKQTLTLNTGEQIDPEHWDKEKYRANPRKVKDKIAKGNLNSLNQYLSSFESKIYDVARSIRMRNFDAGFTEITNELRNIFNSKDQSFISIYDEFLKLKSLNISDSAVKKYKRIKELLVEYQNYSGEKIDLNKINQSFFEKFYSFMVTKKEYINNTINKNIQFLKTFLIWANRNGYVDNDSYRFYTTKSEENEIIYLTEDELLRLYNLQLESEKLQRVRDIFVFQCFTSVRFSDLKNISWDDIKNSTWSLRTQKTKDIIEIPLNQYAASIIEKYRDWEKPLPVISNQKMNKYLKELCKLAKINDNVKIIQYRGSERIEKKKKKYEVIGTHTARRTFITLSLQKGMPAEVIMAITGHKSYRMMQKYLKIANKFKRDEMDKVWGSPLRVVK